MINSFKKLWKNRLKDFGFFKNGLEEENFIWCDTLEERVKISLAQKADIYVDAESKVTEKLAPRVDRMIFVEGEDGFEGVYRSLLIEASA